jgi:carboxymethylenebutenolidase
MIRFSCPDAKIGYAYAMQPRISSSKYLLVMHERWGLDNHTKLEVEYWFDKLGRQVNVLAPDLFDGKHATSPEQAALYMQELSTIRANAIIKGTYGLSGQDALYTSIGRAFGGEWALQAGILGLHNATGVVVYYGNPIMNQSSIARLEADVLGIYAKKDTWVTPETVKNFQAFMQLNQRNLKVREFDEAAGFASPSSTDYNAQHAAEANALALEFIRKKLDLP